ncbi:MAG: alpha/beta fold hydrolase [Actinomycetaceae bacterium]|nr:alpha/beta fold hydrolase [Actinomycetaceae bacterium]
MKFHVFGLDGAPNRLLALHGSLADGQSWENFADELGVDWQVIAPDIAPLSAEEASFDAICDDIAQRLYALSPQLCEDEYYCQELYCETYDCPPPPILLGYSMGGRIALELLQRFPDVPISALVVESAGLGPDGEDEREMYAARSREWAQRFRELPPEEYVSWWASQPLFETQKSLPEAVRERQRAARLAVPREVVVNLMLGVGAEHMHTAQENKALLRSLHRSGLPVSYLAGEQDTKYSAIAHTLDRDNICPVHIFNTGHNIHLEAPTALAAFLRDLT